MSSTYPTALVKTGSPVPTCRAGARTPELPTQVDRRAAVISFRTTTDDQIQTADWVDAAVVLSAPLAPWRTFRWWYGQQHYSGTYWAKTQNDHVIYESRLELARMLYADFEPSVTSIAAQSFLIEADVDGKRRRHIPDFLLSTRNGPIVVDVKPRHRVAVPKVAYTLAWTRHLIEDLGWDYEVWSEPPPVELNNIRFLAGYRDERRINRDVLDAVSRLDVEGLTIEQAVTAHAGLPVPLVRAALCHRLWCGAIATDLDAPLQSTAVLRKGPNS